MTSVPLTDVGLDPSRAADAAPVPGEPAPVDGTAALDGRRVATSAASQFGAKCVHFALNAVSTLALIRYLGPNGYGNYVFVITASFVIGIAADMGLNNLAVREISRDPSFEHRIVGSVMATRLALGAAAWIVTLGVVRLLGGSAELLAAAAVISLLYFTEAALAIVIRFHVRVQQQYEALVRVVIEALETTLVLVLIVKGASLVTLMAAPPAAATVGVVLALALARRRYGPLPRLQFGASRELLREALPIGLTLLLAAAYLRSPALFVASMRGSAEAGFYGAAYQPVEYLLLASAVVIGVMLPLLSRAWVTDAAHFATLYRRGTEALLILTIPVAVVLVVAGPTLVGAVYGPEFEASAAPLRLLAIALVPMVMNFWHSVVLLAGGRQRLTLGYDLVALVVTIALCLVLIPTHGANGAATALLVTSFVVLACAVAGTAVRLHVTTDLRRVGLILALGLTAGAGSLALSAAGLPVALALIGCLGADAVVLWRLGLLPTADALDLTPEAVGETGVIDLTQEVARR